MSAQVEAIELAFLMCLLIGLFVVLGAIAESLERGFKWWERHRRIARNARRRR